MPITTFPGGVSAGGGAGPGRATVSNAVFAMRYSFDATSATQVLLGTVPAGARVIDVVSFGGATGGTNPTALIGTIADDDAFAVNIDSDNKSSAIAAGATGVLVGVLLTALTPIYGKVGASAPTGGIHVGIVQYTIENV